MSTQNVIDSTKSLVSALSVAAGSLAEVQYARAAQDAAVIVVATVEQATDLAWHLAATYYVRSAKYGYVATLHRDPRATRVIIEADGRPELPAL